MAKKKKTGGKTASGKPITDELIDRLAEKAEAGCDVEPTLRRRPGRSGEKDSKLGSGQPGAVQRRLKIKAAIEANPETLRRLGK